MKTFLFILLLLPTTQWKALHFKIKVEDEKGKLVAGCRIECTGQGLMGARKSVTDQTGVCNFTFPTQSVVCLSAHFKSYRVEYLNLQDLEKKNDGDTVRVTMKLRPYTNHKPK